MFSSLSGPAGSVFDQFRRLQEEMDELRSALQWAVNRHASVERDVLMDTLQRGRAPKVWMHEGVELRRRLAAVFTTGFQRSLVCIAGLTRWWHCTQ